MSNYLNTIRAQRGFSLVELMVAMLVGLFVIGGALTVQQRSRATHQVNEVLARMQEKARFAYDVLEADVRTAGFWGQSNDTSLVQNWANDDAAAPTPFLVTGDCRKNWAVDLGEVVNATNTGVPVPACPTTAAVAGTDYLEMRHASDAVIAPASLQAGRIYVQSDLEHSRLFTGTALPGGFGPASTTHNLVTHGYYVGPSTMVFDNTGTAVPALRRLTLVDGGATPAIEDQEIIAGIDDFQVQLGLDTDGDGSVNGYVNPDVAGGATIDPAQILAVRTWLLVRAEQPESGFEDDVTYVYADRAAFTPADGFRRLLISKTTLIRNRLTAPAGP